MPAAERVRMAHEDDGNRRGRLLGRLGVDGAWRHDNIDLEPDQFFRQRLHSIRLPLTPPVFDDEVAILHIAEIAQPLTEGFDFIRKYVRTRSEERRVGKECRARSS